MQHLVKMNLFLFGEGGEGSGSDGSNNATSTPVANKKAGEYDNVVFGKQDGNGDDAGSVEESSGVKATSDTLEARKKSFNDLINGEYKDEYTKATQDIINRRFKETKNLEAKNKANEPILAMLCDRYGISDGDPSKIMKALENDNEYWASAADEAGMTVEQYKNIKRLERENAQLNEEKRRQEGEEKANAQLQKWIEESEALKEKFPSFDLKKEAENPQFLNLLKANVPVEHAYQLIHMDEIMNNQARQVYAQTEKSVVDNIRAKGNRPVENGTASQSAFTIKDDVSKFTKADRAEIAKRVMRGDSIRL